MCSSDLRIAVYRVEQEIGENVLKCLQLRAQFNPEMRYFVTTAAHFNGFRDSITDVLKRRMLTKEAISRIGGLVEL